MCGGTVTITGGVGAGGVTIVGPLRDGAKIVINGDVAGDLVTGAGGMHSGATITITGAVRGVIKATGSISGAKIEAGSCPGGITPVHDISDGGQIICAGQVRFGA